MDYSLVKQALAAAVATAEIPKLTCYSYLPDNPELPCFFAGEVSVRPNNSFGLTPGGYDLTTITCGIFVGHADDRDGQRRLDQLISRDGAYSIRAALYTHGRGSPGVAALGGLCDDLVIESIDGYGEISLGDNKNYYGANISVRLIGSGD
jgi:hypothetical protein